MYTILHINYFNVLESELSEIIKPTNEITPAFIESQLALQGIKFSEADIAQTTQHFQLLLTHAARVMALTLPESIEPAPEFRPSLKS
jgi:hypothetical protein